MIEVNAMATMFRPYRIEIIGKVMALSQLEGDEMHRCRPEALRGSTGDEKLALLFLGTLALNSSHRPLADSRSQRYLRPSFSSS